MKQSKNVLKYLLGILSVIWTLGAYAEEPTCKQPTSIDILRIMGTPFFTNLTHSQQIDFLVQLKNLGIDVDDSLFDYIDIDGFEMQSGEKPSTVLTKEER